MKRVLLIQCQAVIEKHRTSVLLFICHIILLLVSGTISLNAQNGYLWHISSHNNTDRVLSKEDSLKLTILNDYHKYKLKKQFRIGNVNWLKADFNLVNSLKESNLAQNEVMEISKELYVKYYNNKIELYNYKNMAYLYLNLKEAQSSQGAVQFQIPLPNFYNLFQKRQKPKE